MEIEIGQKVQVYRLKEKVRPEIADKLGAVGTVKEFKMTDGSGVGAFVEFDDNTSSWFFEEELRPVG